MKIFWSWQADTPGRTGRHFVRAAVDTAIAELKSDLSLVEPAEREAVTGLHVDQDRQGVPGSPDLAATILKKIKESTVVVADVTPVGVLEPLLAKAGSGRPKKYINSNVAIELGFALSDLGDENLLLVMNEHYGSRDDLPFDLRHKGGPILYRLAPDASKEEFERARRQLVSQLRDAIRLCIQGKRTEAPPTEFPRAKEMAGPALYFPRGEIIAEAGDPGEQEFRFAGDRCAYLRVFAPTLTTPIGLAKIVETFEQKRTMPLGMKLGGVALRNKYGAIIFDFEGRDTITMLTQGFPTGELWGISSRLIVEREVSGKLTTFLPMVTFEQAFVRNLHNYARVITEVLGQRLPLNVVMGCVGINGAYITAPGGPFNKGQYLGPIMEPGCRNEQRLLATDEMSVKMVAREFFNSIYDLAAVSRADVLTDAFIAAHDLPPR